MQLVRGGRAGRLQRRSSPMPALQRVPSPAQEHSRGRSSSSSSSEQQQQQQRSMGQRDTALTTKSFRSQSRPMSSLTFFTAHTSDPGIRLAPGCAGAGQGRRQGRGGSSIHKQA